MKVTEIENIDPYFTHDQFYDAIAPVLAQKKTYISMSINKILIILFMEKF